MADFFKSDLSGLHKLKQKFEDAAKRSSELQKPMRAFEDDAENLVIESFQRGNSPTGAAWAPLAPTSIQGPRLSTKPLQKSGKLFSSVSADSSTGSIVFGAGAPYAKYHLFGTRNVPARPFLPIDDQGRADFKTGRAKQFISRLGKALVSYILTGKVTDGS